MSIYEQFYTESIDDQGCLVDIDIHYPDNFNFGYDVVDAIAEKTPDKVRHSRVLAFGSRRERRFGFHTQKRWVTPICVMQMPIGGLRMTHRIG